MSEQTLGASSPVPRPQRGPISSRHPSPCRSPVRTFWMRDSSPLSDCCPTFSPRPAPAAAPPRADSAHRHRWAQRAAGLTLTRHSHNCGLLSRKQSSQLAAEATACGAGAVLSPEASQAPIPGSPHPITPSQGTVSPPQLRPPPAPRCLICFLSAQALQGRPARGSGWFFRPVPSLQPRHIRQGQTWCWGAQGSFPLTQHPHILTEGRKREAGSAALASPFANPCSVSFLPMLAFEHRGSWAQHPGTPLTSRKRSSSIS